MVDYVGCTNYQLGKKVIFAKWDGRSVVLKARGERPSGEQILGFKGVFSEPCIPSVEDYIGSIKELIYEKYNTRYAGDDTQLISLLWTGKESDKEILLKTIDKKHRHKQHALMRSLWSLIQQDEFLFFRYFSSSKFIPPILGSCGHVYAVESTPPTSILHPDAIHISRISRDRWRDRAKVALGLLDIIKSAQTDFHEYLHLCDIKGKNFGIASDGSVKAIDTDMVFFESKIGPWMTNQTTYCSRDSDCVYISCFGKCNTTTSRCEETIVNNNLEVSTSSCLLGGKHVIMFTCCDVQRLISLLLQCYSSRLQHSTCLICISQSFVTSLCHEL